MRLGALTYTKIDGDIIEAFVRHTTPFVDRIIIVDNASLDNTRVLLEALAGELPLTIWQGEPVNAQTRWRSELVRKALAEFELDYLLLLDPDEFLVGPSRRTLEAALEALPAGAHALVPWRTYVPTRMDDPNEANPVARIRYRLDAEVAPLCKLFVHRAFLETPEATIVPGNHGIDNPAGTSTSMELPGIALAHFPARSLAQMQNKALLGWPRFLAMGFNEAGGLANHWRSLNEELYADPDWNLDKFLDLSTRFQPSVRYTGQTYDAPELVLDALPAPECRYPQTVQQPLATAVEFTRQMAKAYAAINEENVRLKWLLEKRNSGATRYLTLLKEILSADTQDPEKAGMRRRLDTIQRLIESVLGEAIAGDVMQAGLSHGETATVMSAVLAANSDEGRRVWAADVSTEGLRNSFRRYGLLDDRVTFVDGPFSDTLATCRVDTLSVLNVNVATYDATLTAIESLYERVSPKGFVIIQKYGSSVSCSLAVENFRSTYNITEPLTRIDEDAVYWRKQ